MKRQGGVSWPKGCHVLEPSELLKRVVIVLENKQLRYFVTDSIASMYYGEPRMTLDVDVVVDLPLTRVKEFCSAFAKDEYYVSEDAARDAVRRFSQFNILHGESGLKVDVIIPDAGEFNASRLRRARRVHPFPGLEASFSSAEDVILKKLDYYREGQSEKHVRDIASMLKVSGDKLDFGYIEQWVQRLDLMSEWRVMLKRVKK
jgi:hypothetical protein